MHPPRRSDGLRSVTVPSSASARRFDGQVVLVTGSSRNLGLATATAFAREGARVVLNASRSAAELDEAARTLAAAGHDVLPKLADLSDPEQVTTLVADVEGRFGPIDVLVICHSSRPLTPLLQCTDDQWHEQVAINLHSAMYICRAALPEMVRNGGGSVITLTNGGRFVSAKYPRHAAFAALAGRRTLMESLLYEFAPHNIRFNFVGPGIMDTVRTHPEWYPDVRDGTPQRDPAVVATIPLGRPGRAEEVAGAVLWLASEEAAYVNGATIDVTGGWRM
jgi:NAD(P)-dependent dehydrogenase (short-subunit alcohol dehydrogenase family)